MLKSIIKLIITIELLLLFILLAHNNKLLNIKYNITYTLNISKQEIPIGNIKISKINLYNDIYGKNSNKNNIEENVTILKESNYPHLLILAAHSGTGKIAYFNELDKLDINDEIIIKYNKNITKYKIIKIWEEKKNGKIHIDKNNNNQLILTTCSPNHTNYQLIISCIEKESN